MSLTLRLALPHDGNSRRRGGQRDRHIDQQAPPPGHEFGEKATEDEPERGAATGDRAVNAEGAGPLPGLGERNGDQRKRGRREQRSENSLQRTGGKQEPGVRRDTTERGCQREAEQTNDKGALAPGEVGDTAAEEQQAAEGQRVGSNDPLPVRRGDVQIRLGLGHRDVHNGRVEHDHQLSHGDDAESKPPTGVGSAPGFRSAVLR